MKLILNEAAYDPKNTYFADPNTKKVYQWNGSKFVEVNLQRQDIGDKPTGPQPNGPKPKGPKGPKPPVIITGKPPKDDSNQPKEKQKGKQPIVDFTDPPENPKPQNNDQDKDKDKGGKGDSNPNSDDKNKDKTNNGNGEGDKGDETKDQNKNGSSGGNDDKEDKSDSKSDTDSSRNKNNSKNQNKDDGERKKPQIGDRPDDNDEESKRIRDEEERERQAQDGERFEGDEEARLQRIQDILDNPYNQDAIENETAKKVFDSREKRKDAERRRKDELKKYNDTHGIEGFIVSINEFIAKELKKNTIKTYARLNKTYNSNSGSIIRQGRMVKKNDKIPKINVYYDQSGSWTDADLKMGNAAIATLKKYVDKKQLIIDIYYFANSVSDTNDPSKIGGGTSGPPVIEHILKTRPDNVVVMTDSDTDYQSGPSATVPGAVWLLWKNGLKSQYFIDSLHGKKLNKQFDITSGK